MSSFFYLFLNLAIGSFALSTLFIRGQRMKKRHENQVAGWVNCNRTAPLEVGDFAKLRRSQALSASETPCVCFPSSPYRFKNMWEIISETSLVYRQDQKEI
jgi:hypothetical protein